LFLTPLSLRSLRAINHSAFVGKKFHSVPKSDTTHLTMDHGHDELYTVDEPQPQSFSGPSRMQDDMIKQLAHQEPTLSTPPSPEQITVPHLAPSLPSHGFPYSQTSSPFTPSPLKQSTSERSNLRNWKFSNVL